MAKAISKEDVGVMLKTRVFPDNVINGFNEAIKKAKLKKSDIVLQDDVIEEILAQDPVYSRQDIFNNNWLDVEEFYREAGWDVHYSKPAYFEDWKAYFTFS